MSDDNTTVAWASLAISLAGLVTAVVALVWQAVTWKFTGAHVRVETALGITSYWGKDARSVVIVTARNLGRSGIEVTGWGVTLPGQRDWVATRQLPGNDPSSLTLDGLHSAKWIVPLHLLGEAATSDRGKVEFIGWVQLATGKRVTSRVLVVDAAHIAEQVQEFAENPIPG